MKLAMEGILNYAGYCRRPSRCDIRMYKAVTEAERTALIPPVVIVTERDDNPGTSVTNRIEVIATVIHHILEQPDEGLTMIEHHGARSVADGRTTQGESFALVTFTWTRCQGATSPNWTPMRKEQVEEILATDLS